MSDMRFANVELSMLDPPPTPAEQALLDKFVDEYMKDFNEYDACLRVGFLEPYAREYSRIYMGKSYVASRIAELKNKPATPVVTPEDKEAEIAKDKALIQAVLRQAMQNGPYASRVSAARALASIHGLGLPEDASMDELAKKISQFKEAAQVLPD